MMKLIAAVTLIFVSIFFAIVLFRRSRRNKWLARRHAYNMSLIWRC